MKSLFTILLLAMIAAGCTDPIEAQISPFGQPPSIELEPEPLIEPEPEPEPEASTTAAISAQRALPANTIRVSDMMAQRRRDERPQMPSADLPEPDMALVAAIRHMLAINLPNGTQAPVRHCRSAGPRMDGSDRWQRCERRITLFVQYFQKAGAEHGVDPWLLAAMARRESGFHPLAQGSIGEYGIMQLHPQGVGSRSRYVRNPRFRDRCQSVPGACQEEVVDLGASLIGRATQRCGGVAEALGAYNRGRCGATDYSRRVLSTLEGMRNPPQSE